MQVISKKISIGVILIIIAGIFSYTQVFAAELFFGASGKEVGVGQVYEVGVFVNTRGEQLNAFEGEIVFPPKSMEFLGIRDGNSIINMWVERPHLSDATPGHIVFSGMSPGGFKGERGYFFSLLFQIIKTGNITIESRNEHVLRNDGEGSEVTLSRAPLILIGTNTTSTAGSFLSPYDIEQPESFVPTIGHAPDLFDNHYFVAFTTQDKGSGISRYEVAEERYFPWHRLVNQHPVFVSAGSPYVLLDQKLRSMIYIKAIDNAGNERIEILPPSGLPWYEKYIVWCILSLVILLVSTFLIRLYGGKKKNY